MQQLRDRFRPILAAVTPAQRVVILVALAVLLATGYVFMQWLTTPSYSVLYTNLDDATLSKVIDQLNSQKAAYKLNGTQVLVPVSDVYTDRAKLAAAKVGGQAAPPGYELLDGQSMTASTFSQQVAYQRALEGELDKTLMTLQDVKSATVRLAIPQAQDTLFTSDQKPVTAAVLLDTGATLSSSEVDTVVFVVSSAVQGLDPKNVTVADSSGAVLSAPGDGGSGTAGGRQTQQRLAVESSLTSDVQRLVSSATGKPGAVVVRAQLNFNQQTVQAETYDPKATVPLNQSSTTETLTGSPAAAAGVIGSVAGTLSSTTNTATSYNKTDSSATFGTGHYVTSTTVAPGQIQKLSVGIVVDDGTRTHAPAPNVAQLTQLVSAAVGLDPARGDTINVSAVPYPAASASSKPSGPAKPGITALLPQVAGGAVLVLVAVFLLLMTRGRKKTKGEPLHVAAAVTRQGLEAGGVRGLGSGEHLALGPVSGRLPAVASPRQDVMELVTRQPEEIANLLRSWLADGES
jgi:flagellar M-ring protein FliF